MIQTSGLLAYEGHPIASFQVFLDGVTVIPQGPVDPYDLSHEEWEKVQAEQGMTLQPEIQ